MKLSWLEDFVAMVDGGNFSRAAQRRNVTQPAFSRRIEMLEEWLCAPLVERGSYHLNLIDTGARFESTIRDLVEQVYELRRDVRADASKAQRLALTSQHTLMVTHLPQLLQQLRQQGLNTQLYVCTGNLGECVEQLNRGEADMLLCFELAREPALAETGGAERLGVGLERLLPVGLSRLYGSAQDCESDRPLGLVNYPKHSFLGRVVHEQCLARLPRERVVEVACESAFSVGLKEMTLAGMGMAWLPLSLIRMELENGTLIQLQSPMPTAELQIALYRLRDNTRPALASVWSLFTAIPPYWEPD